MRAFPLTLLLACSCGRIGFDSSPSVADDANGGPDARDRSGEDSGGPGGSEMDASVPSATGPFGTPALVPELSNSSIDEDDPTLTGDMLEIYFKRKATLDTDVDIYVSTREDVDSGWSTPIRSDELSSSEVDNTPEVSTDGLTIRIASNRGGSMDIYRSTRATRSAPWSAPERVPSLSSATIQDFAVTTDGAGLNLTMTRIIEENAELLSSSRTSATAVWSEPELLTELNTELYEADAFLDVTGLYIFYAATLSDDTNGRQLLTASRSSVDSPFGIATLIEGVNTTDDDEDPWLSPDLTTMYFVRKTSVGQDIYVATRPLDP